MTHLDRLNGEARRMRCPECGSTNATHVVINLSDDDHVQFYSCRTCEARWWEHQGGSIALDEVLNLAARPDR